MRRLLLTTAAVLAGASATLAIVPRDGADAAAGAQPAVLKVGDRVQVEGQPIGCRVARQDGRTVMDCRRGGKLAGTYGTMLSARKAMVVHYRSDSVAKVVYTATHRGAAHRCK